MSNPWRAMGVLAALLGGFGPVAGCTTHGGPAADVTITLQRTVCFGFCPAYRVSVHSDGSVRYEGECFVAVRGVRDYKIEPAAAAQLIKDFEAADFFSLRDEYRGRVTDNPTYVLTMQVGGRTKTLVDYAGTMDGMPQSVRALEAEVDAVAMTKPLVGEPKPGSRSDCG